ncbi:hypothetical protein RJT34_31913 [Clitoria ternatea]|uniref:Uncharacterized protein n=1 Tax=Clitoria ternatea TaxID=43366 RepID=A0AAN9EVW4_CLITE
MISPFQAIAVYEASLYISVCSRNKLIRCCTLGAYKVATNSANQVSYGNDSSQFTGTGLGAHRGVHSLPRF